MLDGSNPRSIDGRRIVRNSIWNLVGKLVPLLAAVVCIPPLIKGLGVDRFGVLTLAWVLIGYFSLFDFGIGRALTKFVSESLARREDADVPVIAWTGLSLMALLSVAGTAICLMHAEWLIGHLLRVPPELHAETLTSFKLLAWSLSLVIIAAGFRGVIEAYQRFDLVNAIHIPQGILTYLLPVIMLAFTSRLDAIVFALVVLRAAVLVVQAAICIRLVPNLVSAFAVSRQRAKEMLNLGGWMTVSNIVGPLMVYGDRFVIGSTLSVAAVAYYVTPYEIVTRLLVVPAALVSVIFPAFASSLVTNTSDVSKLFSASVRLLIGTLFPAVFLLSVFANEVLTLWLSPEFAQQSASVLRWLAAGVFLNGLSNIPFAHIQARGRADLTAKVHLIELPFYIAALLFAIENWGINGAAAAWTIRTGIDSFVLFLLSVRLQGDLKQSCVAHALTTAGCLLLLAATAFLPDLATRVIFATIVLIGTGMFALRYLISSDERAYLKSKLQ